MELVHQNFMSINEFRENVLICFFNIFVGFLLFVFCFSFSQNVFYIFRNFIFPNIYIDTGFNFQSTRNHKKVSSRSSSSQFEYTINGYFSLVPSTDRILVSRRKSFHRLQVATKDFQVYIFFSEFQNLAFLYKMFVNYSHAKMRNFQKKVVYQ